MDDAKFQEYVTCIMSMCGDVMQAKLTRGMFVSNLESILDEIIAGNIAASSGNDIIDDGFGNICSAWCPTCKRKSMQVVRPGKFQCGYCG